MVRGSDASGTLRRRGETGAENETARPFRWIASKLGDWLDIVGMNEARPAPIPDLLEGQSGELDPLAVEVVSHRRRAWR